MLTAQAERTIVAAPSRVYRALADYRTHHPRILPPGISELRVEEGGVGAGTVVSFKVRTGPKRRAFRMKITEPEPGRVLVESDTLSSMITTFRVEPARRGSSRVRIETRWDSAARGMGAIMERLFAPPMMRLMFSEELRRLARYVRVMRD